MRYIYDFYTDNEILDIYILLLPFGCKNNDSPKPLGLCYLDIKESKTVLAVKVMQLGVCLIAHRT